MTYTIRKAVVIGSGTMGGGIASLLAGVGVDVLLLDIPARDTQPGDKAAKRSAIANEGLKRVQSSRPAQLFAADDLSHIRTIQKVESFGHKVQSGGLSERDVLEYTEIGVCDQRRAQRITPKPQRPRR